MSLRDHSREDGSSTINPLRATTVACYSSGRMLLAYANRHWLLAFRRNGSDWRVTAGNPESAFISIAIIYHHKFRRVRRDRVMFLRRRGTHYSRTARNSVRRIVNFLKYLELVVWHVRSKLTHEILEKKILREKNFLCNSLYDVIHTTKLAYSIRQAKQIEFILEKSYGVSTTEFYL